MTGYRPGPLAHLVQNPIRAPWIPPPALVPYEDPWLMRRVLEALKRL